MREDYSQDEIGRLVKEELSRAVAREAERLAHLELKVIQALEKHRPERSRGPSGLGSPKLRPAWALATAVVVFVLGFLVGTWTSNPLQAQGIAFVVFEPSAKEVTLAISYPVAGYQEWQDIPLQNRNGLWYINLQLPPGTYEYGFKIDGQWWAYDPAANYFVKSADNTVNAVREIKAARDHT